MPKKKNAQDYSADEFDQTIALITNNPALRADIEAITGQQLDGKTPRQMFDLFRSIDRAAEVTFSVAKFGKARQMLRQTRVELQELPPAEMPMETAAYVERLQHALDAEKQKNQALKATNVALTRGGTVTSIARPLIKGEVAS